jgi:adenylate kinase
VAERLAAYTTETKPTIDWYEAAGMLVRIDGLGTLDEVTARLVAAIDARLGS